MANQRRQREEIKRSLAERFGGKCQRCGYDRCMRALQFHHADDSEKKQWSKNQGRASFKEINAHPERFLLLCANCHFEEHERIDAERRTYILCGNCGRKFRAEKFLIEAGKDKFCSPQCQHDLRTRGAPKTVEVRFLKFAKKTDSCWNWTGYTCRGTPMMQVTQPDGKHTPQTARRVSYSLYVDKVSRDHYVVPACGNPLCVNPAHLELRTGFRKKPSAHTNSNHRQGKLFV